VPHWSLRTRGRCRQVGDLTKAVHSGQQVVNPDCWPVLPLARRCHVGSLQTRCRNAATQGAPGSCSPSTRRPTRAQLLLADDGRQSSPVPSDALAAEGERGDRRRSSARHTEVLEVRRTFVASRLSAAYLAAAYADVVPRHRRRMGLIEVDKAPFAEAPPKRAVGEGRGIRDV
jgi:hypothetical protein